MISDGDLGLMDHLKKEHWSSEVRFHVSSSIQQYTKKCFFPVLPFFSSFSQVDVCVCVCLLLFWRGGGGGSNDSLPIL